MHYKGTCLEAVVVLGLIAMAGLHTPMGQGLSLVHNIYAMTWTAERALLSVSIIQHHCTSASL